MKGAAEMLRLCFSPVLACVLLVTLLGVGASAATDAENMHRAFDWSAVLNTVVGGLIASAMTVPVLAWRLGRWLERKTTEIETAHAAARLAHARADAAHTLAVQALDEGRDHVADHARGAFLR